MTPTYDPPWMPIARAEIGVTETPGPASTARIVEYKQSTTLKSTDDAIAWCSDFANFVMQRAGHDGTKSAAALSWAKWGISCSAIVGAIGVQDHGGGKGHVTFVVGRGQGDLLVCLGGNQNDSVKLSAYPRAKFVAFRWPPLPLVSLTAVPGESTR